MKQSEIYIGGTYILGRAGGPRGVTATSSRMRVIEKALPKDKWSKRLDHVRVVMLDENGNEKVYAENDWNAKQELVGKPVIRVVSAKVVLSVEEVERRNAEARKEQEEREARNQAVRDLRAEIEARIVEVYGISTDSLRVGTNWDHTKGVPVANSITITDVLSFMTTVDAVHAQISTPAEESK